MAINKTIDCLRCGKTKTEVRSLTDHSLYCRQCEQDERHIEEDRYIAKFCSPFSLAQRIENIERELYRMKREPKFRDDIPIG